MERYYRIANINFRVQSVPGWTSRENGMLETFRTEECTPDHSVRIELADELSAPEGDCVFTGESKKVFYGDKRQIRYEGASGGGLGGAYMRILRQGDRSFVELKRGDVGERVSEKLILNSFELEHQLAARRGFLFHSSYIRRQDGAILFTAPSGTGKSTQAALWCRLRGAELINGDRAAVVMEPDGPMVHGVPYSGSSKVSKNRSLPLKAIVYLSQAKETTIRELTGLGAFKGVWEGCSVNLWNRDDVAACMQTVMETVQRVPVFHLACLPDESAVLALESALGK